MKRALASLAFAAMLAACGPSIGFDKDTPTHSLSHPEGTLRVTVPERYGLCGSGAATIHARSAARGTITPVCQPQPAPSVIIERYPTTMSFSLRDKPLTLSDDVKTLKYAGRTAHYTITANANGNGDTYYVFEGYVPFEDRYLNVFAEEYTELMPPRFQNALTAMFTVTRPDSR